MVVTGRKKETRKDTDHGMERKTDVWERDRERGWVDWWW